MKSHAHTVRIVPQRMLEAAVLTKDNTLFFHVFKYFEATNKLAGCEKYVQLAKHTFKIKDPTTNAINLNSSHFLYNNK